MENSSSSPQLLKVKVISYSGVEQYALPFLENQVFDMGMPLLMENSLI